MRQVDHLGVVAGPERLGVGRHAERREPRDVVGVDDLEVGDVMAGVGGRSPPGLPRTHRAPRGPRGRRCAWKWTWNPSASRRVTARFRSPARRSKPAFPVSWPWTSRYGVGHRRSEVLAHAVLHDLDRGRREPADGPPPLAAVDAGPRSAPRRDAGPTTARDHPGRELASASRGEVRGERLSSTMASCQPVIPRQCRSAWARITASSSSAGVGRGTRRPTKFIAPSWSVPLGARRGPVRSVRPAGPGCPGRCRLARAPGSSPTHRARPGSRGRPAGRARPGRAARGAGSPRGTPPCTIPTPRSRPGPDARAA